MKTSDRSWVWSWLEPDAAMVSSCTASCPVRWICRPAGAFTSPKAARMSFTTPSKPSVITAVDGDGTVDFRYLIMPVRLPG